MSDTHPLSSLVQTKLHRPPVPHDLVPRTWLIDLLNQNQERALTVISAAAGYGKTTLIAHWLQHTARPSAWLALDEHDHDLISFLTYFVAALQTLFSDAGQETLALLGSGQAPPLRVLATTLINELNNLEQPFILVVDDYHLVHDLAVHEVFNELLQHPPAALHLVLITRIDPPLNLVKLAARNQALILRAQDLRFLPAEAMAFMQQGTGRLLGEAEVAQLVERAEGWAAGLRLLHLMRQQQPAPADSPLPHLPGERLAIDYLFAEVLQQQPREVQDALLHSAILDQFCAPLLDAIGQVGRQPGDDSLRGDELIAGLLHANAFLTPLDDAGYWFKYHTLFRDLLLQELKRRYSTEAIKALHHQASQWYAAHGPIEESIHHAVTAGDTAAAVDLVAQRRYTLLNTEQWPQLERWLTLLPAEAVAQSLPLTCALLYVALSRGQLPALFACLQRLEVLLAGASAGTREHEIAQSELDVALAAMEVSESRPVPGVAKAQNGLKLLPPQALYVRAMAIGAIAVGLQMQGDLAGGAAEITRALGDPIWPDGLRARLMQYRATALLFEGDLIGVLNTARTGLAISQPLRQLETSIYGKYHLGVAHYLRNDLTLAEPVLQEVFETRARFADLWVAHSCYVLALIYLAQDRAAEAAQVVTLLIDQFRNRQDQHALAFTRAFQVELAVRQGELATARLLSKSVEFDGRLITFYLYAPCLTPIKLLLAEGTPASLAEARARLEVLDAEMSRLHRNLVRIDVLALQALVCAAEGDEAAACDRLAQALVIGEPGGFIRNFVDLGSSMAQLLIKLRQRGVAPKFIAQILAAFPNTAANPQPIGLAQLIEPLTERELEILALLAQRLSNKEIAEQLTISAGTAKRHTINIYQKLQVNDRHQAVSKARALGLLARN